MNNTRSSTRILTLCQVIALLLATSCAYNDFPKFADCSKSTLGVSAATTQNPTLCTAIDGSVTLSATGGDGPYTYSLNGSGFQSSNLFSFLGPGNYLAVAEDAHGCQSTAQVSLSSPQSSLVVSASVTADTECLADNGSISIIASAGTAPYTYQFENGTFGDQSVFTGLPSGTYTVTIKDATKCPSVVGVMVPHGSTGVSYTSDIKPILQANCAVSGCHNGSLGDSRDWRNYDNVKTNAQTIKTRTTNRSMPAGGLTLTDEQIKLIACWVNDGANNN